MATKEKDVLDALVVELEKIKVAIPALTVTTILESIEDIDHNKTFPWLGIFPERDTMDRGTTRGSSGVQVQANYVVLVYVETETPPIDDLLIILGEIKKQIEDDPKLGLLFVIDAKVTEVEFMVTDRLIESSGDKRRGMMEVSVVVDFRHARNDP